MLKSESFTSLVYILLALTSYLMYLLYSLAVDKFFEEVIRLFNKFVY